VPVDEYTHRYMITWGRRVDSPEQANEFVEQVKGFWAEAVPTQFNNEDVMAREAMADFYAVEDGWYRERLFAPDVVITEWRKLASKRNRGIQRRRME
jgi:carbazole 1,9a-dioxygenase terminal dioxygenase component